MINTYFLETVIDHEELIIVTQLISISVLSISSSLIRLEEPYVRKTLFKFLGCRKRNKKQTLSDDSLNSFLNSAMNVEFVYLILESVRGFMNPNTAGPL